LRAHRATPRLVFAGTPEFAVPSLDALVAHDMAPVLVLTQPDRPAGRGRRLTPSPVKLKAEQHGLPVRQPATLINKEIVEELAALAPDALVVVAYGLLLPPSVLAVPRAGCINVHASLLPRWRGAAPVEAAILAGDADTGVSLMRMDEGLDTGPVYARVATGIGPQETAGELKRRLAALGAELLVAKLPDVLAGKLAAEPQPAEGVTHAPKVKKEDARLDWTLPAAVLARRVRAYDPEPGARFVAGDETVKCWRAEAIDGSGGHRSGVPGAVLAVPARGGEGIDVACGEGVLRLLEVQRPGRGRVSAFDYARQVPLAGRRLAS
jgi:methionyl-tRNA formyltransferase